MHMLGLLIFLTLNLSARTQASGSIAARGYVTENVLELTVNNYSANSIRKRDLPPAVTQEELYLVEDGFYTVLVKLGSKQFGLHVDTGAVPTWVATHAFQCLDSELVRHPKAKCAMGPLFNPHYSTTLQPQPGMVDFEIAFKDGYFARGKYVQEELSIGGLSSFKKPHSTVDQIIGLGQQVHWDGHRVSSGTLGLGFSSQLNTWSFLHTLFQETSIEPIFSLALYRSTSNTDPLGGYLAFGGIPDVPTDTTWASTPIISPLPDAPDGYTITVDGFDITLPSGLSSTHTPGGRYISSPHKMIVDSGTTKLLLPVEVAEYIASLFDPRALYYPPEKEYHVSCTATRPRVGIKIAGISYFISDADLLIPTPRLGENVCVLQVNPVNGNALFLGQTWLKNVVVAFDFRNEGDDMGRYTNGLLHVAERNGLN
ncbi:aspartic peptidase domain-containing protein [Ampelomyces quisqualis]|uniref:Aspartic peptidase domain-containing protein n=1 Tax=Ampelomyces quisqualis TaxID=50730 RepID=A0A6A5QBI0_AMPQU|nr:aspartic peptidase domain-containing protein [Ampelomyces quisqualis]